MCCYSALTMSKLNLLTIVLLFSIIQGQRVDLYVEINCIYRIYDRRSGVVRAAVETTLWGSLAENLARHISKSLDGIAKS